jgi:hypothetical protein
MAEMRNAHTVLIGKPEGIIPLGRPRRSWEDDIKMDLRVIRWKGVDWMHLDKDRDQWWAVLNAGVNLWIP